MTYYIRLVKLVILFIGALVALTSAVAEPITTAQKEPKESLQISNKTAIGKNGIIAAAHPAASEAGLEMLKKGGNAVDAALASSFAIAVLRPQSTGLGGGGFMMLYLVPKGKVKKGKELEIEAWDFRERAPLKASRDMFIDQNGKPKEFMYNSKAIPNASLNGHLASGIPGLVAGLIKVHKLHGKLSLEQILKPAIKLSEKGFTVYPQLEAAIQERREVMEHFKATREIFAPKGRWLEAGDILIQKDLAWTLRQIAKRGVDGFYKGPVADRIVAEMARGGGLISYEDLKSYEVKKRSPIEGTYRGYKVVAMPPPSSGGVHIIQMLNMMEGDDLGRFGQGTAQEIHFEAEVMRRAFADRAEYLGDPDFARIPGFKNDEGLVSKTYAKKLRETIQLDRASSSNEVKAGTPPGWTLNEPPSTTHIAVADKWGNVVSTTQTINFTFGSCVVAEGTGIVLNDEMDDFSISPGVPNAFGLSGTKANEIAAKKTMLSSMSPTLVFLPDGDFLMALGSPGGPRIITAVLQTTINVIDHKMSLAAAIFAPRIHHQWYPDEIRVEKDNLPKEVLEKLQSMGHTIAIKEGGIGDVQAVMRREGEHDWVGVSDTRSDGIPMGY